MASKDNLESSIKILNSTSFDPATPLLGIYSFKKSLLYITEYSLQSIFFSFNEFTYFTLGRVGSLLLCAGFL